jgi:hypothetical protein
MLGRMTWTAPQITRQGTMFAAGERQMLIPAPGSSLIDGGHLAPLLTRHERLVAEVSAFLTAST